MTSIPPIVDHAGAQLVHPEKAYVIHSIDVPDSYASFPLSDNRIELDFWQKHHMTRGTGLDDASPDVRDYILRLQVAVDTLFGATRFALHALRSYRPSEGLDFHRDFRNDEQDDLVRMATCIHNVTDHDRKLQFRRRGWTGHTEAFALPVPSESILTFSDRISVDYEHGYEPRPKSDEPLIQSVVTRFALWQHDLHDVEEVNDQGAS